MENILNQIKKNKKIYIISFCWLIILWIVWFLIFKYIFKEEKITEERVNISEFSNVLEMKKEWKVLWYPEITILSNIDWEVLSLDVSEWDIVEEWQILMQIWDSWDVENFDIDIDAQIWQKYARYYEKEREYDKFQALFWEEISSLENKILQDNKALNIAIEMNDESTKITLQNEIREANERLKLLKTDRDKIKSEIINIENDLQIANKESIQYYYDQENHTPRATIWWIIWNIYVKEWDEVKIWDKLATIIDNSFSSEVAVWLDFNEYLLTKNLSKVSIMAENENRGDLYYNWEIYSRSPILNMEWNYTFVIRFLEEVRDLVLNDENTKIIVNFPIESDSLRIPERCFTWLSNNTWTIILHDGEVLTWKEVWIKNKWDGWINIRDFIPFPLEKWEKKDGINLYFWKNIEILCRLD